MGLDAETGFCLCLYNVSQSSPKNYTHLARIIAVQTCTKEKQTVNRQKHTRKKEGKEEFVGIYCHAYQLRVTGQGLVVLFSCFLLFDLHKHSIFIGFGADCK